MYIAICDDEEESIIQVKEYIEKINQQLSCLECSSFKNAESFLAGYKKDKTHFDILITDIEMDSIDGVDLAQQIRDENPNIIIIFITSHVDYAVRCFRPEPLAFWVKPIDYGVVKQDILRAVDRINDMTSHITIMEERFPVRLDLKDIKYIEKLERKTIIHTTDKKHYVNKSVSYLQNKLPSCIFVRIYISYIVNLEHVKSISNKELVIKGSGEILPVSRNYIADLREKYINFNERKYFYNVDI